MPENDIPPNVGNSTPSNSTPQAPPRPASPPPPAPPVPAAKAASSGSTYDDFGKATRNLPPATPVAVAIVLVAVVVGVIAYINRAKPTAQGSIDGVWFSQPANMSSPMILMEVTLHNTGKKTLYIKDIKASVTTDQGDQSDDAASASDYDRYLIAYPALSGHAKPLQVEMRIAPGAEQKGSVMISPPITQQQFDARKDLTVTIERYDQAPVVIHEKAAAQKE